MPHTAAQRFLLLAIPILVAAMTIGTASPQEEPAAPDTPAEIEQPLPSDYQEQVEVVLRQVTFLVLDRKGRPVTDLGKNEVRVWEDGKRQEIKYFERAAGPSSPSPAEPATASPDKPDLPDKTEEAKSTGPSSPAPAEPEQASPAKPARWIVLLFDARNSSVQSHIRSAKAARDLVRRSLHPTDRVALMVSDDELRTLVPFTTDHNLVAQTLESPSTFSRLSRDIESLIDTAREQAEDCQDADARQACVTQALSNLNFEVSRETRASLEDLTVFIKSLEPIRGRKLVFFFSDGFIVDPGSIASAIAQYAIGQVGTQLPMLESSLRRDFSPQLADLYALATEARVGFYPVNCMGWMTDEWMAPSRQWAGGPEMLPQAQTDPYELTYKQTHKVQTDLALVTGGATVFRRDPAGLLGQMLDTTGGVYTIGYRPPLSLRSWSKLKIKVDRPGTRVHFRNRLLRRPARSRLRASGEIVIPPDAYDGFTGMLRTEVHVSPRGFVLAPESDPGTTVISFFYEVWSLQDEQVLQSHHETVAYPRNRDPLAPDTGAGFFKRPFALRLPPGSYRLHVYVRDLFGDAGGSFVKEFTAGKPAS